MVLIGAKVLSGFKNPFVSHDDRMVGYLATRHLIKQGHREILCLTNTYNKNIVGILRLEGYKKALKEAGIKVNEKLILQFCPGSFTYQDAGYKKIKEFLKSGGKCSSIFSHCDRASLGIIKAIRESGLKVPEDIAVVSVDNDEFAEYIKPSLTTISLNSYKLGQTAAESLCRILNGKKVRSQLLKPKLIVRESCGIKK